MLFDKERLAVRAGKPVEIIFENTDLMPHNLVITVPGALEEIGTLAEAQATQPGALERHYVPASGKVIKSTKLVPPRNSDKLSFTAPTQPGVYPYVCTYPGHWRRMYGALYEWKYDDLAPLVEKMDHGRSFANGKQMFQVANCVACHKLNGVGQETGPDLAKYDPKWKPTDILKDVLEPSFRINEKFQTYVIETEAGKTYTGLVIEETGDIVKVLDNPLLKAAPIVLKKSQIASRQKSPTSMMPKGLLDKMTKEEILDLIAYVVARGEAKHALFQGAHEHKH
jgi:putative heme-binding domain-containing protein